MKVVSDKNIKRFALAVKNLNSVILDCKKDNPECFAYLDGNDSFNLLDGSACIGEDGDQESILVTATLNASGGDW